MMEKINLKLQLLFIFLTSAAVLNVHATSPEPWSFTVDLDNLVHVTDAKYLSYGMDSNLIRHRWETFDFHSDLLKTLAAALSPAYLRLMGTDGDRMIFVFNQTDRPIKSYPFPPTGFVMTSQDWDNINHFTSDVGWRLLFGINGQTRIKTKSGSQWNATNAKQLLEYSILKGYAMNMDFEFGNEPDMWPTDKKFINVPPEQLAQEFQNFRHLLDTEFRAYFSKAQLVGPDIAFDDVKFLMGFLSKIGNETIDAITWHHYYGGGELKYVENYTDSNLLDTYAKKTIEILDVVKASPVSQIPIWQGETSSTYSPPGNGIDETYVAGFMLLDKLGLSASLGIKLVVRQTFYGFWFALVGQDLIPRPNYWTALLYHRLVGQKVFAVTSKNASSDVRLYAHCTSERSDYSPTGSIVIYGMNLLPYDIQLQLPKNLQLPVDAYVLSPSNNNLTSTQIELNGKPVKMVNNYTLPELTPKRLAVGEMPVLPSKRYAYFVVHGLIAACLF